MHYNFDKIVPRSGTNSLKFDHAARYDKPADAMPLWVADMDFQVAPAITAAITTQANHAIYGYTETDDNYYNTVANWFKAYHNYETQAQWLIKTPGIVFALGMGIRACTSPGDAILIQKPLYYPIENTIVANGRRVIDNTLVYRDGKYEINFSDFEEKIAKDNIKLFVLCNPHNPGGRVWTHAELYKMGQICKKYNCAVLSDEIHCDLTFKNHKHIVFSTVCESFGDFSIICTSPSKTFNIAGLQVSNIFISNEDLRQKFAAEIHATGYSQLNTMGLIACEAAYTHGRDWLDALMHYLSNNVDFLQRFIEKNMPDVHLIKPEGSYLLWLDFSKLIAAKSTTHESFYEDMLQNAKVWLSDGLSFGETGRGFFRINIACPQSVLAQAMERLQLTNFL